jgi:signal transduction histidine kinase
MNDVIQEALILVTHELERHAVVVHTDLATNIEAILADRVPMQQVLLNLFMNAIEAMSGITDRPKVLTVSSRPVEPATLLVTVEDTGVGLDAVTADRIFDPWFTTKNNGMGLGLSICRSIIEAHTGRLWAESRRPCGMVFRFRVPNAKA